jgi:hypothetical protein
MRCLRTLAVAVLVALGLTPASAAADQATASVVVMAQFSSRTSLKVSARLLQFDVASPSQAASAAVEFSAGARTDSGAEVMLSVEPERAVDGPGGAADVETSLTFTGEGQGTLAGSIASHGPTIAGRWSGSGIRTGRLIFSLRAATAGSYTLPVRFILSTP